MTTTNNVSICEMSDKQHLPNGWITIGGNPHPSKVVGVYFVLYELPAPVLVYVDPACLAVVYLAFNYCRVGTGFHLKPSNPVIVNVIRLKIALQ